MNHSFLCCLSHFVIQTSTNNIFHRDKSEDFRKLAVPRSLSEGRYMMVIIIR
jgi:hypothetical protein